LNAEPDRVLFPKDSSRWFHPATRPPEV